MENSQHSLLRIYASSTDKVGTQLLYEYIVHQAKNFGINGVTVFRGIMGFGASSKISSSKFWELTEKLPVSVELVDETAKLNKFYDSIENELHSMPKGCMVTLNSVDIKLQKPGKK